MISTMLICWFFFLTVTVISVLGHISVISLAHYANKQEKNFYLWATHTPKAALIIRIASLLLYLDDFLLNCITSTVACVFIRLK